MIAVGSTPPNYDVPDPVYTDDSNAPALTSSTYSSDGLDLIEFYEGPATEEQLEEDDGDDVDPLHCQR